MLCRCNGITISDVVYKSDFKVLMSKIVCVPENVIGKAQRPVKTVGEAPFTKI